MKDDFENQNEGLRSGKLAKRRKTNLVLNSLIAIVLLLIIFVSVNIFFGDVESKGTNEDTAAESKTEESSKENAGSNPSEDTEAKEDSTEAEEETDSENKEEEDSEPVVTEGGSSPDVKKTIENPDWEPVGTSQSGEHVAVYDQNAVDWQEMIKAISYATGIDSNNMTVWFLGNNGGPNSAAGTISEKGGSVKYRVAIEWVDGKGWKPVKVEELK